MIYWSHFHQRCTKMVNCAAHDPLVALILSVHSCPVVGISPCSVWGGLCPCEDSIRYMLCLTSPISDLQMFYLFRQSVFAIYISLFHGPKHSNIISINTAIFEHLIPPHLELVYAFVIAFSYFPNRRDFPNFAFRTSLTTLSIYFFTC